MAGSRLAEVPPRDAVPVGVGDATGTTRLHPIDWLRALALVGVFLYHAVHPFDTFDWHVKNAEQSEIVSMFIVFVSPWGLGLFFLLAGAGAYFSLRSRSAGGYAKERITRLLVPLLVVWLVLAPVQAFIEAKHLGTWDGSFLAFIPRFFDSAAGAVAAWPSRPHPMIVPWAYHLWFLVSLLWFAFLALPLFLWLRGSTGRRLSSWLASLMTRRGSSLLLATPIIVVHLALKAGFPDEHDWGETAYYLAFFVNGYLVVSEPRLLAAVRRDAAVAVVVGLAVFATFVPAGINFFEGWEEDPAYTLPYVLWISLFSLAGWAGATAALGYGLRARRFQRPLPTVVADSAMPFFLVHQPVILAVAFFVVQWSVGIPVKLPVVVATSFVASCALAWALSRAPVTRMLLGVKPRRSIPAGTHGR